MLRLEASLHRNQALEGVDRLGPSRRAVAWGVATRGQGQLSGESEPKAPEGARQRGAVCKVCWQ